jgi:dihydrofolate synthase/folylpolyglutamate synthase
MAFEYFAKKKVDIAIIETGLGGRFDSTNVLTPLVSIITRIDYDHSEYLGDTIEEIAFEKAGIIKQNVPLVLSQNAPEVREVIKNQFDLVNGNVDNYNYSRIDSDHKEFFARSPLPGRHVKENLRVVLASIEVLRNTYRIFDEAILDGISKVRENTGLSSRIELIQSEPPLILDVSHNESAIATLIETLKSSFPQHEKWEVVFAAMKDKKTAKILNLIKPICGKLHLPQLKIDRAEKNTKLKQIADTLGFEEIQIYDSVEDLFQQNITAQKPVLITGSFYLAGEILPIIKNSLNREKKVNNF